MGQLNIKDEALIAEARLLAEELGTSVTGALREAVAAMRAGRRRARGEEVEARVRAIMAIAEEASKHKLPGATSDHSDLYDEHGLPR